MIYNIQFDSEGYVTDLTALPTALPDYAPYELTEMPRGEYLSGCYRLDMATGKFVLDEVKRAQLMEIVEAAEE